MPETVSKQSLFYDTSKGATDLSSVVEGFMRRAVQKYGEGNIFVMGRKEDVGKKISNAFGSFVIELWPGALLLRNHWVVGVKSREDETKTKETF